MIILVDLPENTSNINSFAGKINKTKAALLHFIVMIKQSFFKLGSEQLIRPLSAVELFQADDAAISYLT